uniref:Intraflagellar transport protein 122 homolog n=1 Tax=Schistocephalus solidus TaxID=70667 RepID=A0A0X3PNB8_SCHSO
MECLTKWTLKAKGKDGNPVCVWDLCYSPNGYQLVVAGGNSVLVHRAECGTLIKALKGHKDAVICVDYSFDGSFFASGSLDRCVIVWKAATFEGFLKYTHNESIQALSFNPKVSLLASSAIGDIGFWAPDQKSVSKMKVPCRALTLSWTSDGNLLAVGLQNGMISVRKQDGTEVTTINRNTSQMIWNLKWNFLRSCKIEILAVADFGERLSFYQLAGKQVVQSDGTTSNKLSLLQKCGKDRFLGYIPCCMSWVGESLEFLVIGGQNRKLMLYSYEGCQIGPLTEENSWILSCKQHPKERKIALACQDGTIRTIQYSIPVVHSLYRDRYAFRESISDVVIQHLLTEQKARIKCRDVVKKIAVFKNRLAIQLSDRVLVYDSAADDPLDMHYRIQHKLLKNFECQLLVVTAHHIVLCQECRVTCINVQGQKEREWVLDSPVRYIRQLGGPPTRESLIVGMESGQTVKITLNSVFPVPLIRVGCAVKCLDLSCNRDKLAVIDESNTLSVHSLRTKEILFREPEAASVAWNQINNEILCYSGPDALHVKAGEFPSHQQAVDGVVVGFTGSSVFCLAGQSIKRVDVPLSPAMYLYLESGKLTEAHQIACLGVTDPDWRALAEVALTKMNFNIAKSAYIHLGDYFYLTYIQQLEERQRRHAMGMVPSGDNDQQEIQAELACFTGKFNEAVRIYKKAGRLEKVVELLTDLRRFNEAKEVLAERHPEEVHSLLTKHAEWARTTKDHRAAAMMYLEAGDYGAATELAGEHGWVDLLLDISRQLDKADRINLDRCAKHLARLGEFAFAADCYARIGDVESQLDLHLEAGKWEEALALADQHGEFRAKVYLPYAQWLAENDSFEEAQAAFARAGLPEESIRFLEELASCAVFESRFDDASWYFWKLSRQCAETAKKTTDMSEKRSLLRKYFDFSKRADIYFVYNHINKYMNDPFASHMPEAYFNMARYLLQRLGKEDLEGVSKVNTLFTLAKHSKTLGAFKVARGAIDRLQTLHIKQPLRSEIEAYSLAIRSTPFTDSEELSAICFRCSATNPLLSTDNRCFNCKEPFVHSFISFETLPLVEFIPEAELTEEEVAECIQDDSATCRKNLTNGTSEGRPERTQRYEVNSPITEPDLFAEKLISCDVRNLFVLIPCKYRFCSHRQKRERDKKMDFTTAIAGLCSLSKGAMFYIVYSHPSLFGF